MGGSVIAMDSVLEVAFQYGCFVTKFEDLR